MQDAYESGLISSQKLFLYPDSPHAFMACCLNGCQTFSPGPPGGSVPAVFRPSPQLSLAKKWIPGQDLPPAAVPPAPIGSSIHRPKHASPAVRWAKWFSGLSDAHRVPLAPTSTSGTLEYVAFALSKRCLNPAAACLWSVLVQPSSSFLSAGFCSHGVHSGVWPF